MKTLTILLPTFAFLLGIQFLANAQVPQAISYQAIARNAQGVPLVNSAITVRLSVRESTVSGIIRYQETHSVTSNAYGLFTVGIGQGSVTVGTFAAINWANFTYFLQVEANNGGPFVDLGTSQFLSSAYAQAAQRALVIDAAAITTGTINNNRLDPDLQDLADGSLTGSKVGTGINANNITAGKIGAARLPAEGLRVPGEIIAFAGDSVPEGWLLCDGSAVSRTTYAALFQMIGLKWGGGDGTTTFNLPDLRGRFLRGVSGTSGNDPDSTTRTALFTLGNTGNNVGSYQNHQVQLHQHRGTTWHRGANGSSGSPYGVFAAPGGVNYHEPVGSFANGSGGNNLVGLVEAVGGSETRPKNANVNYIIKY